MRIATVPLTATVAGWHIFKFRATKHNRTQAVPTVSSTGVSEPQEKSRSKNPELAIFHGVEHMKRVPWAQYRLPLFPVDIRKAGYAGVITQNLFVVVGD